MKGQLRSGLGTVSRQGVCRAEERDLTKGPEGEVLESGREDELVHGDGTPHGRSMQQPKFLQSQAHLVLHAHQERQDMTGSV